MTTTIDMVREFHEAFELGWNERPRMPLTHPRMHHFVASLGNLAREMHQAAMATGGNVALLRLQLMTEELAEVAEAVFQEDTTATLHELADLRYVCDGTIGQLGLAPVFRAAFEEIHRANMSKLDEGGRPIRDSAGRVVKSELYKPADISRLIVP